MTPTAGDQRCETAGEILRVAARLFAENGYDATPVRAIAEAARVTCPTLYYHHGNKEGLAQALLTAPLEGLARRLEALADEPTDPVRRLVRLAEEHFAFNREDPDRARFLYAVMFGPLGRGLAEQVGEAIGRFNAALRRAVAAVAEAGLVAPEVVPDLMLSVRGQIVIRTVDHLYRDAPLGPEMARRMVLRILLGHAEETARGGLRAALEAEAGTNHE